MAIELWGMLCFFHGGTFGPGPPIEYKAAQCTSLPFDCDRLNVGVIMDAIVSFGYEDVMIKNVYYTTIGGSGSTLKCLAGDDNIRDIMCMVHVDGCVDIYVDHEVNFAQLAFPELCWVDNNVVEEEGRREERVGEDEGGHEERVGEGINSEVCEGANEGDLGNITQEYPVGSKANTGNTFEKDECSKGNRGNCGESEFGSTNGYVDDWSSTNDEVKPLCSSDRDDEELINVKKHARSTFIKKPAIRSTPVFKGKKVASLDPIELRRLRKEKAKLAKKKYKTLPHTRECQKGKDSTPTIQKKRDLVHPSKGIPIENDVFESDNDGRDSQYENSDAARKLRDSSIKYEEENLFFVLADATRQMRASNVYFNLCWDVRFFEVGMRFQNATQFKEAMKKYSMRISCPLLHTRNKPKRQRHKGDDIKLAFGIATKASYQIEFLEKMEELRGVSEEAYAKMMDLTGREKGLFVETWPNDIAPRVMKKIKENIMRSM
ncbi:hypothetical protein SLEP1_g57543 [Rubroshorea leprosula]|uniref:PB1-like domain-containing protein n=1 Tax=Rubroshorea leprosula TaxID=152421 RepID=A0AAV5MLW3_9ROSI|nr:hypothetical protein SLEP1_g57543 [Rubroshorea leprosula]